MVKDEFVKQIEFPVSANKLFKAWLNGADHGKMTGGDATGEPTVGSAFTAWDGYISGKNLELELDKRILQTWRTSEFSDSDDDSMLEVLLEDIGDTCQLTLKHWNIPEGQGKSYFTGWDEHYFEPMQNYFIKG